MTAEFTLDTHLAKLNELIKKLEKYRDRAQGELFFTDPTLQDAILHKAIRAP